MTSNRSRTTTHKHRPQGARGRWMRLGRWAGLGAIILLSLGGASCAVDQARAMPSSEAQQRTVTAQDSALTAEEAAGLQFMREEEKLARDVYLALGTQYDHVTFERIAQSEQRHMDAIGRLLETYGLDDPIDGHAAGQFHNAELQQLHDQLMARGSQSLGDALAVGALIEEVDIADLRQHLDETERPDITRVYENLLRGSRNHLRAFVGSIEASGADYQAQHLPASDVAAIVDGDHEPGAGRRGGGRGRGGGMRGGW